MINCTNEPYRMEAGQFLSVAEQVSPLPGRRRCRSTCARIYRQPAGTLSREEKETGHRIHQVLCSCVFQFKYRPGKKPVASASHKYQKQVTSAAATAPTTICASCRDRNVHAELEAKLTEPITSPWSSNVLLVKKRDDHAFLCEIPEVEWKNGQGVLTTAALGKLS